MGGKWPYSCYFVECCNKDLFKTARSIIVWFSSSFFFFSFSFFCLNPCSASIQKYRYSNSLEEIPFYFIRYLISIWVITCQKKTKTFLCVCWHHFKLIIYCCRGTWTGLMVFENHDFILQAYTSRPIPPNAACSRLHNWDLAWVDVFVRSAWSFT